MAEAHPASPAPTEPAAALKQLDEELAALNEALAAPSEFYVPFPSGMAVLIEAVKHAMAFAEDVKAAKITYAHNVEIDDHMAFLWNALPEVERS